MVGGHHPDSLRIYVLWLLRRSEIPYACDLLYDAYHCPSNPTKDELAALLESDSRAGFPGGRRPSFDDQIFALIREKLNKYDSGGHTFVGVYQLPGNAFESREGQAQDSSDLPEGSWLAGWSIWQKITPASDQEAEEQAEQASQEPTLRNRLLDQFWKTRHKKMAGKEYWLLKLLCVSSPHQRKGLGTMLVRWGVERANKEGLDAWTEASPLEEGACLDAGFRVLGVDRLEEPIAKKGYVEWPYLIYERNPAP